MDQGFTSPSGTSDRITAATGRDGPTRAFAPVVTLFGVIWLLNAWFQFSAWVWLPGPNGKHGLAHVLAKAVGVAPDWLRPVVAGIAGGVDTIGPRAIAGAMVVVALLLGLALITRVALRAACWFGMAYCVFCWVALCALGWPYGHGQTDPGVFPAYFIAFVFVLSVIPVVARSPGNGAGPASSRIWAVGRLLFGLLWAFDAVLKWQPYFLTHFLAQLTPAVQGQPAWIAAYINFIILIVTAIGPLLFAVVIAIVETTIAASVLTGWWLDVVVPLGLLYSLSVWTTGEGWGGPYSLAGTGVRGDVLGNVLIYAVIFLFFLVPAMPRLRGRLQALRRGASRDALAR